MTKQKNYREMKLHERKRITITGRITLVINRVDNGLIYEYWEHSKDMIISTVFVPFVGEFEETKNPSFKAPPKKP